MPPQLGREIFSCADGDLHILLALGAVHHQKFHKLVSRPLKSRPLHGGVVGLRPLHDALERLVRRCPVCRAALLLGLSVELRGVLYHVVLRCLPQRRHRHLVRLGDGVFQSVIGFRQSPQNHVPFQCAVMQLCEPVLHLGSRAQFAALRTPQAVLQQRVAVLCNFCFYLLQAVFCQAKSAHQLVQRIYILCKLHCRVAGAAKACFRCRRRQAGRLHEGHVHVKGQHSARRTAPQPGRHPVAYLGLLSLRVHVLDGVFHVVRALPAPDVPDGSVQVPSLDLGAQQLVHVPQRDGHARILSHVLETRVHYAEDVVQINGLRAVLSRLQKALAAHAVVVPDALVLHGPGVLVHPLGDVVLHNGLLPSREHHTRLVDVLLRKLQELLVVVQHLPGVLTHLVVGADVFAQLRQQISLLRPQKLHLFQFGGCVAAFVQDVPLLVELQVTNAHSLGVVLGPRLVSLYHVLHVRDLQAAVGHVVQALLVLSLDVQRRDLRTGHQPFPAIICPQPDVHQLALEAVHLLQVPRSGHVVKDSGTFHNEARLFVLALVQHLAHLFHVSAVYVAAKALKLPLDVQAVHSVVCRELAQCTFQPLAEVESLCLPHLLVCPLGKLVDVGFQLLTQKLILVFHNVGGLFQYLPQPPQLVCGHPGHAAVLVLHLPHLQVGKVGFQVGLFLAVVRAGLFRRLRQCVQPLVHTLDFFLCPFQRSLPAGLHVL